MGIQAPPGPGVPRGFQPDEPAARVAKVYDEDGTWGSRGGGGRQRSGGFDSRPPSIMSGGPMASSGAVSGCRGGDHGPEGLLSRPEAAVASFRTDVGGMYGQSCSAAAPPAPSADVCGIGGGGGAAASAARNASRLSSLHSFNGSEGGYAPSGHGGVRDPPLHAPDSMSGHNNGMPPLNNGMPPLPVDFGVCDSMADRGYGGGGAYGGAAGAAAAGGLGAGSRSASHYSTPGGADPLAGPPHGGPGAGGYSPHRYPGAGGPDPLVGGTYGSGADIHLSHHCPPTGPEPALPRSSDDYSGGGASRCLGAAADDRQYARSESGGGGRRPDFDLGMDDFGDGGGVDFDRGMQSIRGCGRPGSPGGQSVGTMSMLSDMSPGLQGALRANAGSGVPLMQAQAGTVVEVFSATTGRWYPAEVTQVQPGETGEEVLTVQFYMNEDAKQKSMYRSDQQLAPLGSHTGSELPPGFEIRPSQSRPGQLVYLDATTGTKYASAELAWHVHFERMQQRPAVGCETVCAVRPSGGAPAAPAPAPPVPAAAQGGPKALTLAELQSSPEVPTTSWPGGLGSPGPAHLDPTLGTAGKVALPSFGDAMGSQAAYLCYEGKASAADALASASHAQAKPLAPLSSSEAAYPMRPARALCREGPRRPARPLNPALHTWQEDAFSEWRGAGGPGPAPCPQDAFAEWRG